MFKRIATMLWGNFENSEELKKFGFLAAIFGLIIGTYWTLRPMKDGLFNALIGIDPYQPYAKILSLFVVFPLVIIYSKLIDTFPRQKVFYVLVGIYALLALVFVYFMLHPTIGLANTLKSPSRLLGWCWYLYVESFGSLIVALFWAFTTDTTLPDSAKRGFPIIALFGQMGNMLGPLVLNANRLGFSSSIPVIGITSVLMLLTIFMFWLMIRMVSPDQFTSYHGVDESSESGEEPGFLEGLKLLLTKRYLLGIFLIVTIYEVIITVIDFHFKATAASSFGAVEADYSSYLAMYGWVTGLVSMLCVLFGINNIQRKLGMKASLVLLPILVTGAVLMVKFNPAALTVAFWIMVFSKAVNYALNQPTLKQLYIPTTKDTRYKAQAWIEMFGSRGSKAGGSAMNTLRGKFVGMYGNIGGINAFLTLSTIISGGMIVVWLFAALFVSKTYNKAIEEDRVVC